MKLYDDFFHEQINLFPSLNDHLNLSIEDFNNILNDRMVKAEKIALKNVGR